MQDIYIRVSNMESHCSYKSCKSDPNSRSNSQQMLNHLDDHQQPMDDSEAVKQPSELEAHSTTSGKPTQTENRYQWTRLRSEYTITLLQRKDLEINRIIKELQRKEREIERGLHKIVRKEVEIRRLKWEGEREMKKKDNIIQGKDLEIKNLQEKEKALLYALRAPTGYKNKDGRIFCWNCRLIGLHPPGLCPNKSYCSVCRLEGHRDGHHREAMELKSKEKRKGSGAN